MSDETKESFHAALESIGLDTKFFIKETFLGYKYRKREKMLYDQDVELPTKLIKLYYGLNQEPLEFDTLQKAFITHYVNQESQLEGVDIKSLHSAAELEGFRKMYEYIHSTEIDEFFSVHTLKDLHRILYSCAPYPEFGGALRQDDRFLPGTGTELCPWRYIPQRLYEISPRVDELVERAKSIRETHSVSGIIQFIDDVMVLKSDLVLIHPFPDGNGRCIRGFVNKLFEYAGLPPVYIKVNERTEYHKAMNKANNEKDYTDIQNFYKFKLCDSIVELDINERIKQDKDQARRRLIRDISKNKSDN
jgi:fido (protein-threonine AMPylation protein)